MCSLSSVLVVAPSSLAPVAKPSAHRPLHTSPGSVPHQHALTAPAAQTL